MIYDDIRVLDRTVGLPGAYCAKLLTDLGADVVRVETSVEPSVEPSVDRSKMGDDPNGDPMRADDLNGLHDEYLRTSQRCIAHETAGAWEANAHIVLRNTPGPAKGLVNVTISEFGFGGPDDHLNAMNFGDGVLQARSGAAMGHGNMSDPPLIVNGNLGSYCAGVHAALGAVTALRRALRTGVREYLDVSQLESMQLTMLTTPTLFANFPGGAKQAFRFVMIPGNEPCGDGNYVGITTNTAAQWRALCVAMGRDDLLEDASLASMIGRFIKADVVNGAIREWTGRHTAAEIELQCEAARVPVAIVGNGKLLLDFAHLQDRGVWQLQPGHEVLRPRAPFRFGRVADRELTAAPGAPATDLAPWPELALRQAGGPTAGGSSAGGSSAGGSSAGWPQAGGSSAGGSSAGWPVGARPLEGVKVLDFTAFWAGPAAVSWLAAMGADVIKVEAIQRLDGMRMAGPVASDAGPIYELSPLYHASNLNKRAITLDLGTPEGVAIAKQLAERADIVCENFTPRVMEDFGLTYDDLRGDRDDLIMLRLPAFGLTGPWRDRPGFAQTMEQLTGMAWTTGYEGGPPIIAGGVVDPMVGAHAALAVVAALAHRDATGEGQLVEVPMVEVALATTADQIIRYQITGDIGDRRGAHGMFRCANPPEGYEGWIAIDSECDPMSTPQRESWCAQRTPSDAERELIELGIPALAAVPGYAALDDAQMVARRYFEPVTHRHVGEQQFPGWPIRFDQGPQPFWRAPAPCVGEHNREVLIRELGITETEFSELESRQIIGTEPVP